MSFEDAVEYALCEKIGRATPTPIMAVGSLGGAQLILTRREEEVAALVAQGLTNRQIATELSISEHTVATHLGRILNKVGLSSRSRLAAWVSAR